MGVLPRMAAFTVLTDGKPDRYGGLIPCEAGAVATGGADDAGAAARGCGCGGCGVCTVQVLSHPSIWLRTLYRSVIWPFSSSFQKHTSARALRSHRVIVRVTPSWQRYGTFSCSGCCAMTIVGVSARALMAVITHGEIRVDRIVMEASDLGWGALLDGFVLFVLPGFLGPERDGARGLDRSSMSGAVGDLYDEAGDDHRGIE